MIQRMRTYELLVPEETVDPYGERVITYRAGGAIRAAISLNTGQSATINNVRSVDSTHTALVKRGKIIPASGQRLKRGATEYQIEFVNDASRQCFVLDLKRVDAYG